MAGIPICLASTDASIRMARRSPKRACSTFQVGADGFEFPLRELPTPGPTGAECNGTTPPTARWFARAIGLARDEAGDGVQRMNRKWG